MKLIKLRSSFLFLRCYETRILIWTLDKNHHKRIWMFDSLAHCIQMESRRVACNIWKIILMLIALMWCNCLGKNWVADLNATSRLIPLRFSIRQLLTHIYGFLMTLDISMHILPLIAFTFFIIALFYLTGSSSSAHKLLNGLLFASESHCKSLKVLDVSRRFRIEGGNNSMSGLNYRDSS